MKIYIMLWSDRHSDITATPFLDLNKAIEHARKSAKSACTHPEDYKETPVEGLLFHAIYSCENDCVWITEHEINIDHANQTDETIPQGPRHMCGACEKNYPPEELAKSFDVCEVCKKAGKELNSCADKNGVLFYPGRMLKSEQSNTWIQVLQINDECVVSDKLGAVDREDFVKAGWVVHERVKSFRTEGINDDFENCIDQCEFMPATIGSLDCSGCNFNKGYNEDQQWVICELYNQEKKEIKDQAS